MTMMLINKYQILPQSHLVSGIDMASADCVF